MYRPSLTRIVWGLVLMTAVSSGLPAAYGQQRKPKPPARGVVDTATSTTPAAQPGKYYALVIGESNYQHPGVPKLITPAFDANSLAALLSKHYGFSTRLMLDATRDEIITALNLYRRSLTENTNLLIWYAGHGYLDRLDPQAELAYWLPVDADRDNNVNWISANDITYAVRAIPAKHVLVISDSCYSGAILNDTVRDIGTAMRPQERALYLAKMQNAKSRSWMASGGKEPVADDGAPGHSVFAAAVLQGLTQMQDNQFAASDLFYSFIRRKVSGNSLQSPLYGAMRNSGDDLGDFIFSRGGAAIADVPETAPDTNTVSPTVPDRPIKEVFADLDSDRTAIKQVLDQYQLGRNRKDSATLWKVWPTAPVERKQMIEAYFKNAKSVRTTLQMDQAEIASDHVTATVTGQMQEQYTPKSGDAPPARNEDIRFTLKKNNGVWTIVDIK